jgi:aldose 1-epimerase
MIGKAGTFAGEDVLEVRLASSTGAEARVLTWGAVIRDLTIPVRGTQRRVVLGFPSFEPYPTHSPHYGAIAGRFANRIDRGRFTLDGAQHRLALNQNVPPGPGGTPTHHLHGGIAGFGKRNWSLVASDSDCVTLALVSADGDQGYPGEMTATCRYRLIGDTLRVELTAVTDRPTIVNLAHHSYFNLDGAADVGDHLLTLDCDFRTPVGPGLIPTGEIVAVAGTDHDFRAGRPMRREAAGERLRYDDNFIRRERGFGRAARVEAPDGFAMEVWTAEPAIQFYDGHKVSPGIPGLTGRQDGPWSGFCLEPQRYPDSPNHAHFTGATLRPGEVYRQETEYRFG